MFLNMEIPIPSERDQLELQFYLMRLEINRVKLRTIKTERKLL